MSRRWFCFDVGETLINETRLWGLWADACGVSPLTMAAATGATIALERSHQDAFALVGVPDWRERESQVQAAYGGFAARDLYPDALPTLATLAAAGYRIAVMGNQPAHRHGELAAIGVTPDVMAMSQAMGPEKPDPAFFTVALRLMGDPDPHDVAYVGDRVDNDVGPSAAAGMRPVWVRRGPWGVLHEDCHGHARLVVRSLRELVDRVDEVWA